MPLDRPNRAVSFSGIHIVHSSIMKFIKPFYRLLSFSTVKPSVRLFLGFFAVMWLTSCGTSKQVPEMNSTQQLTDCTRVPFHSISATQQDALPGVESNLRKQRTYRLEMGIPAEEGDGWLNVLESINQWELWVDSVAVPLRFQPMQADMSIAFSGLRMFYTTSSEGSMQLPVENYDRHGTALNGTARLVGYSGTACYAHALDTLVALPLIVAP